MFEKFRMRETPSDGGQDANLATSTPGQPLKEPTLSEVNATLQTIVKRLDSQDGTLRALQSGKDRAVNRIEKSNQELYEIIGQRLGVPADKVQEAQRQSVLDEMVNERITGNQPIAPVPPGSGSQQGTLESFTSTINTTLGLPSNDPRVTELALKYTDQNEYLKQAVALRDTIDAKPAPTPAEGLLPTGTGVLPTDTSETGLQAAYERERNALYTLHRAGSDAFIRAHSELQDRYAEKGLNF